MNYIKKALFGNPPTHMTSSTNLTIYNNYIVEEHDDCLLINPLKKSIDLLDNNRKILSIAVSNIKDSDEDIEIISESPIHTDNSLSNIKNSIEKQKNKSNIIIINKSESTESESTEPDSAKSESTGLESSELDSAKSESTELESTELESSELESTESDSTELESAELEKYNPYDNIYYIIPIFATTSLFIIGILTYLTKKK